LSALSHESAAVLRRLLEAHPDFVGEAEEIARSFLHEVSYEEVAANIEDEIRAQDYEALNARAGRQPWSAESGIWRTAYPMWKSGTSSIVKDMPVPKVSRIPHGLCGGSVGAIRFLP
jgi:hypothetical protein